MTGTSISGPITVKLKKHRGYQIRTIKGYYN